MTVTMYATLRRLAGEFFCFRFFRSVVHCLVSEGYKAWQRVSRYRYLGWLLSMGLLLGTPAYAQTMVSGSIALDTHWTASGAPYVISGDVVVQNGATLTIDPAVTVYMAANSGLRVQAGAVRALGSAAQPIRVLSEKAHLGQSPAAGDWKQWVFTNGTANTRLEHVEFAHGSGLVVNGTAPIFNYLNIHDQLGAAIFIDLVASPSGVGNQASKNGINAIAVPAGDITGNVKWGLRGIPYSVANGTVSVGASPVVTSISPNTLQQGETATITVTGSRLSGLAGARFGSPGLSAQVVGAGSDTQGKLSITAEPNAALGNVVLRLLVDAGEVRFSNVLTVVQSQPVLTSLAPSTLYLGQGAVDVTLNGRNFTNQSVVLVNGTAVPAQFVSATQLRATITPPSAVASLAVKLQTPDPVHVGQFLTSNELPLSAIAAQLVLTPSSVSIIKGVKQVFTATLPYAAPTGGAALNLVSSVPTVATVPASVTVPEGQSSVTFELTAADLGVSTLTVSRVGFLSAQAQVTVTPPPTLTVTPSVLTLGVGRTAELTIQSSVAVGPSGLPVNLISSDPSIATLPASVTIPAGMKTATVSLSTVAIGSATVTAQAIEFVSGSAALTVRPISLNLPSGALVAPGLTRSIPITLSDPAPSGGLEIALTSSAVGVATVPATITMAAGQSTANFTLTGVSAGNASINASATGYQSAVLPVTVEAVTIGVGNPAVSSLSVPVDVSQGYAITLSRPAPVGGVVVNLATADSTKAVVAPTSIAIAEGQTSGGVVRVSVAGVAKGSTTLVASAPGLNAASIPVTVTGKPELLIRTNGGTNATTIGKGLKTYTYEVYVYRKTDANAYAPNEALTVNLASSDPAKASVPATATIPAGSSQSYFYITGVDLTNGTPVTIDATATGYTAPATKLSANVVTPEFRFNSLDAARSPASARDDFQISAYVPGAIYPWNQMAAADLPIGLSIAEANPAGIVEGFYTAQTGGALTAQVMLRKDNTYSDTVYVGTPTGAGSYKVQAGAAGVASATSGVVMVSAPELRFATSSVTVGKGLKTYYWEARVYRAVNGQAFNGAEALTVNLVSSDPAKVSVPATVTIPAGSNYAWFYVSGTDLTNGAPITIDATATGYTAPSSKLSASVVAPTFNFNSLDTARSPASARDNFQMSVYVPGATYPQDQTAVADLPIGLSITEASPAGIVDGFYTAQTGGTATSQVVLRKDNTYSDWAYIGTPTGAGSYKVEASAAGIASATSGPVTVSAPEVRFTANSVTVGKGLKTYYWEVRIERAVNGQAFNGAEALTVNLVSSDPSKVSVPATVTIPAGSNYTWFHVTGVDLTNGTPVTIDATATGYTAPATKLSASVVVPTFNFNSLDTARSPASARDNFRISVYVPGAVYASDQTAAADLPIGLSIAEASPAGIVDGFYTAQTGGAATGQVVLRKDNTYSDWAYIGTPTVAGSYKVEASAAGIASATSGGVTVSAPELRFSTGSVTVGKGLKTYYAEVNVSRAVNGQSFNGNDALTVNLTCNSTAICKVPSSVTIPAGSYYAYVQVEGVDLGNTTITASAVGYSSSQDLAVSVITPQLSFSGISNTTVGGQSTFRVKLYVPGANYAYEPTTVGGLTLNLTSSAPGVAGVTPSVTIPVDRNYSDVVTLTGIAAGTTTITASGSGLVSVTSGAITINP